MKLKVNNEGDCNCLNHKFIAALIIILVIETHLLFHLNYVWKLWPPQGSEAQSHPP